MAQFQLAKDLLHSNDELSNRVNTSRNLDNTVMGIRIRSRPARSQPNIENSVMQGYAPRRVCMQCKLQVGSLYLPDGINTCSEEKEEDSKLVVYKEVKVMEEDMTASSDVGGGTDDKPQEISLSELCKNCVSNSKTIV